MQKFSKKWKIAIFLEFFSFVYHFLSCFYHFCFQWCKNFPKNGKLQFSSGFFHSPQLCVGFLFLILYPGLLLLRRLLLPPPPHTHRHTPHTHTDNTHTQQQQHTDITTHTHTQHTHNTTQHTHTVAGVAQPDIHLRFTWQAWHSWHWVARLDWLGRPGRRGTLRGRRGTNSHPHVVLRGRRGTTSHPLSFCVAGVALMALGGALGLACSPVTPGTPRHFAWQAWHNLTSTVVLRGRRGTHGTGWRAWTGLVARDARDAAALCVAGVAQTHIHRRFAWQAWHNLTSTCRFAWQAWHSWHWVARLDWLGRPGRRGTLRGRRGTNSHPPSFCVAGAAQPHIHRRFAWQAWHSWHWVARLDWLGRP